MIYAALGAPLSFISLYYNIYSVEEKILSQQKSKSTSVAKTRTKLKHSESSTTNQEDAQAYDDEDEPAELISKITSSDSLLGKSYVHLLMNQEYQLLTQPHLILQLLNLNHINKNKNRNKNNQLQPMMMLNLKLNKRLKTF